MGNSARCLGGWKNRVIGFLCVLILSPSTVQGQGAAEAEQLFALRVFPLLRDKCGGCHGNDPQELRGQLDMSSREGLLAGGESGEPALVPGRPDEGLLLAAIAWEDLEMPPKENDRLSAEQIEWVRQWVAAGAPWPDAPRRRQLQQAQWEVPENDEGVLVRTSGGLAEDWTFRRYRREDIWAFQPLPPVVQLPRSADEENPIDSFIQQRLDEAQLVPAAQATPAQLVRRAYLDLIGLPPTPAEVEAFIEDDSMAPDEAWDQLLTTLLESPHYGERWGQHWLDVVRYADTSGFSNDYERSNAWRYRDYVVRSFNKDKPYDQFVIEQLAGDQWRPEDPEMKVATGFLRMGPWGTAMIPAEEARQLYLDDLVHQVGQTFLSMPLRCSKCHDHKFDPVPTRDYYRLMAALAATQPAEMPAAFLPEENRSDFAATRPLVEELLEFARGEFDQVYGKQEAAAKRWYEEHGLAYKDEAARIKDPEDQKPPRHVGLTPEEQGILKVRRQDVWIWERRMERFEPMAQSVYDGPTGKPIPNSRKLRKPAKVNQPQPLEVSILAGGSLEAPLEVVSPGVLSAAGPVSGDGEDSWSLSREPQLRRLELARWIANSDNPLTARSLVNRVWQHHFGVGLVETSNNFGVKGGKPSHPQLLDWLTRDFIDHGWKIKRLHRQIMTSKAYRRSTRAADPQRQAEVDPNHRLLASFAPRRLTAEELRDSILQVTGELNPELGGLPIMPEINQEVALQPRMIQFSIAPAYQPSRLPRQRNRRTMYAYRVRGQADPLLEVLNLPNPNESCELRDTAAVTPQAFTLFHSDFMTDRAIAMALRLEGEHPQDGQAQLQRAFQLALLRLPTEMELQRLSQYLDRMKAYHAQRPPEPRVYPTEITRSLVEELTGQPFEFLEKLNVFEDYVPDAKPWTVAAETRALADVCLLLFNANEFMYVY